MQNVATIRRKVLIVDDEVHISELLEANLEILGEFDIRIAMNGVEALNIITTHRFPAEIIFSDCRMPVMGGIDFARSLQRHNIKAQVILMSGNPRNFSDPDAQELSGIFLTKPFSRESLRRALERAIIKLGVPEIAPSQQPAMD